MSQYLAPILKKLTFWLEKLLTSLLKSQHPSLSSPPPVAKNLGFKF